MHRWISNVAAGSATSMTAARATERRYDVAREDELEFTSAEYVDLYHRSRATMFQHPLWLHEVYRTLAPRVHAEPVVVTVRSSEDRRLLLVLPLVRRRHWGVRHVEFADLGVCDYAAPVLDEQAASALLADPDVMSDIRLAVGPVDLLRVDKLPGSPTQMATLLGTPSVRRLPYSTHRIGIEGDYSPWQQRMLDPSFLRHLARKRKRLRPKGELVLRTVHEHDEVDPVLERIQAFRRDRFEGRRAIDLAQDPDRFAFYGQVAHEGIDQGGPARLVVLTLGGEVVAATLDLVDEKRHLFLLVGYDFGRLRNYSLGLLIVDLLLAAAFSEGTQEFDLTIGDEGYKADFGARPTTMFTVRCAASPRGRLAAGGIDAEAWARRSAKRMIAARERMASRWSESRERRVGSAPPVDPAGRRSKIDK